MDADRGRQRAGGAAAEGARCRLPKNGASRRFAIIHRLGRGGEYPFLAARHIVAIPLCEMNLRSRERAVYDQRVRFSEEKYRDRTGVISKIGKGIGKGDILV